jgi:hypothetical protein
MTMNENPEPLVFRKSGPIYYPEPPEYRDGCVTIIAVRRIRGLMAYSELPVSEQMFDQALSDDRIAAFITGEIAREFKRMEDDPKKYGFTA